MKDKVELKYKAIEDKHRQRLCPCNAGYSNGLLQMSCRGKLVMKGTKYS